MTAPRPIGSRQIFRFWLPMAFTWLMMALEGPFLAAVIARLENPRLNLAAFGVAFAFAIIVESPVIMILSASTALASGREAFCKLRRFAYTLNAAVTATMLLLLFTPAFAWLAREGLRLPPEIAHLTRTSLIWMLPWPAAIGYRRFLQGLMIRAGQTRRIAYGTVTRLTTMALTGLTLQRQTATNTHDVIGAEVDRGAGSLTYSGITRFYYPLALTSIIGLAAQPIVTFFMGQARFPIESLAALPVVNSLTFIFRAAGLSFQEVAIALLERGKENYLAVRRFALGLALAASLGLAAIAFTPLATVWFHRISGLDAELTTFALGPTRILTLLPFLSVVLALQRAILVHARRTVALTWATAVELGGIVALLLVGIAVFDMVGATAAAVAIIGGRIAGNLSLAGPCLSARR